MLKHSTAWACALAALVGLAAAEPALGQAGGTTPKFAFVNAERLLREAPGASEADSTFQREFAQWQAQLTAKADTLQRLIAEYDRQQVTLTPEAKERRQQEIRQRQSQYQQLENDLTKRAEQRRSQLLSPITRRILETVEGLRREGNYTLIFTAQALVAADTALDLTEEVLARLKAQAQTSGKKN